ncbi:MAG TPA: DNA repair protein RecO [Thermoclostridium caenicola]|nr:DNA repair protein RecO [Thermoclostridium caenicola]
MALIRTKGLVIKEVYVDDADKIITLMTENIGKISVSARGARKNGRQAYGTQILTYGQYILYKGRNSYSLNGCDILTSFFDLANDLERFTYAAHMMELASDACTDDQTTGRVLNLLLHGLNALNKGREPMLISSAFSMKLAQVCGYPPHVTSCANCHTKELETIYFSFKKCGFICEVCAKNDGDALPVTIGTAKAILHVLCSDQAGVFSFNLSSENLERFSDISNRYIAERFDKRYEKLNYLKEIRQVSYHLGGE